MYSRDVDYIAVELPAFRRMFLICYTEIIAARGKFILKHINKIAYITQE